MSSFWLNFVISEAITVAEAFVSTSNIKPGIEAALENFITSGQKLVTAIQAGN